MRKRFLKIPFLLTFVLLASCTAKAAQNVVGGGRTNANPTTSSEGYIDQIEAPMINKIISKIEVNLSTLVSWDTEYEQVQDYSKVRVNGTYTKYTAKQHSFYEGKIARIERDLTTYNETEHGSFKNTDKYVLYYFTNANINGMIMSIQNEGVTNLVSRSLFNFYQKGEKMQHYLFYDEILDLRYYTEAYYDKAGNLNIITADETTNTDRIQHHAEDEGFIGVTHTTSNKHFYLEKVEENNYYNYRLTGIKYSQIVEKNFDEDGNKLDRMAVTELVEYNTKLNYNGKLESDVLDVNENQLLNAFNYFDGSVYFSSGTYNKTMLNLSSLYVDEATFSTIHHYYGALAANKGDICSFSGSGNYHYMQAGFNYIYPEPEENSESLDSESILTSESELESESILTSESESESEIEPEIEVYYNSLTSNFSEFGIDLDKAFFEEHADAFKDNKDGTFTARRDITFEVDLYLLVNYVTLFYENAAPSEGLQATVISLSLNEF